MKIKNLIILLSGLFFILNSVACNQNNIRYHKCEGAIWNTLYHITYKGASSLQDSILPVLNEISLSLSVFDPESKVTLLNKSERVNTDRHLKQVYETSKKINLMSKGKFDPTLSPLIDAWGFGKYHSVNRDTIAIDSILKFVGLDKTELIDNQIIKKDLRTQFNFSAIAKGYGCDAIGEMFKRNGVKDYMVEIGGEISLSGHSPSGKDWLIGIDAPIENNTPGEETALILSITDKGIATSGNYRNFRGEGSEKTAHTISAKTGRPYISEILSATVIAPTCMEADGIATACMAGNPHEAMELLQESQSEGLLILRDTILMTPGFKKYIISEFLEP